MVLRSCLALVFVLASLGLQHGLAAPAADLVSALPGWSGALPSKHYSGFLDVEHEGAAAKVHYSMAMSEKDPTTAPTLFWFNGGPPCSSLIGAYTEVGPFRAVWAKNRTAHDAADDAADPAVALMLNPSRWNAAANLVFVETPLGVGFSHYADGGGGGGGSYAANDTSTASLNLHTLLSFFATFPELQPNELFLAGESYAGIYVPLLAQQVLAHNKRNALATAAQQGQGQGQGQQGQQQQQQQQLNLAGVLVGNGAVATGAWYEDGLAVQRVDFLRAHALFPATLRAELQAACGDFSASPRPAACNDALRAVGAAAGNLNVYDVRETCLNASDDYALLNNLGITAAAAEEGAVAAEPGAPAAAAAAAAAAARPAPEDAVLVRGAAADPCLDGAPLIAWLNQADVQAALHVAATGRQGSGNWTDCGGSFGHDVTYKREPMDERATVYPGLVAAVRVLVYNGDQDVCIPYVQDEAWTTALAAKMALEPRGSWRPWLVGGQVAGYETRWGDHLTFATVKGESESRSSRHSHVRASFIAARSHPACHGPRALLTPCALPRPACCNCVFLNCTGAGHMVPEKQPERALAMLQRFIDGTPLASSTGGARDGHGHANTLEL
jgi:carboxypeptidase C (cathepsin A)